MLTIRKRSRNLKVLSHDKGGFASIRNSRILIYFPHGFGDWVHFSHVVPYLDPSNKYFMTRYGDDTTALMEDSPIIQPIYMGIKSPHCVDGDEYGAKHFGIDYDKIDGSHHQLILPQSIDDYCELMDIDVVFFTSFPEVWGETEYPYQSKARQMVKYLAPETPIQVLNRPLSSCINLRVDESLRKLVESKLRTHCGFGSRKLCIIGRNGYTAVHKNWGHLFRESLDGVNLREGEEARDFMRLMLRNDPRWMFLTIEDRVFTGDDTVKSEELNCYSYAELFGTPDDFNIPFGLIMKALVNLADLSVGVPAGPHHLCMLRSELPSVGIWIAHLPSWYDEPKDASIHVVSNYAKIRGLLERPGSFACRDHLRYRQMEVDSFRVTGEQVLSAALELI